MAEKPTQPSNIIKKPKPGPMEERVKIDVPWEEAMKIASGKPKPKDGWPK